MKIKKIAKNNFYDSCNLTSSDKEMFKNDINKIILECIFSEDRINIKSYKDDVFECEEVAIIRVILNSEKKYKRISSIIQKAIPYSIILICEFENKIIFNVVNKKINKVDEDKNTLDEMIFTEWIKLDSETEANKKLLQELNIKKWSYINLYKFYNSFVDNIKRYNASKYTDNIEVLDNLDINFIKETSDKIEKYELEIISLKNLIKKEVQFNKKIDLNMKIRNIEKEKNKCILDLKGN